MTLRSRPDQRLDTPGLWTATGDDVLGRVISGALEQPGEAWTIERLAAEASMSRATFLRHFSARTGTTVAREVGYRSESAFSQAFRAALGTSPARFRRESSSRRPGTARHRPAPSHDGRTVAPVM
ncbi:AraC family transcriptional regulator [Lentzea sp. NBRC 102530]|uniref:AraC family transcriptional regulator n=1 Tax=Lentzea sp. NBRC 102530 TaxID=3032201 RepID=UPI002557802E|nr:AraC family transcriptional regulator [Lentzea sp. NBRC 102530]